MSNIGAMNINKIFSTKANMTEKNISFYRNTNNSGINVTII